MTDFSQLRTRAPAPLASKCTGRQPLTAVGRWHCIEARAKLNDPGWSNGAFQLWIDDRLETSQTGLGWMGSYQTTGSTWCTSRTTGTTARRRPRSATSTTSSSVRSASAALS